MPGEVRHARSGGESTGLTDSRIDWASDRAGPRARPRSEFCGHEFSDARPVEQAEIRVEHRECGCGCTAGSRAGAGHIRSEEHTSELQSLTNLVCRLLLEKKKKKKKNTNVTMTK